MTIAALDTHQTVKNLAAAGFTDAQTEALTHALQQVQNIDLSDLAAKAELKTQLIKWVLGIGLAQVAAIDQVSSFMPFCTPGRAPTRSPQACRFLSPALSGSALRPA